MKTSWLTRALVAVLVVSALYLGASEMVVRQVLTAVRNPAKDTPMDHGMTGEELHLTTSDHVELHGYFLRSPARGTSTDNSEALAIVMVHGIDGCGYCGYHRDLIPEYLRAGFDVVIFDLRGQGASGDAPLGLGWREREDVRAAVDWLVKKGYGWGHIGVHGSSYGAATALLATAALPAVGAVIADSAFADLRDIMRTEMKRKIGNDFLFIPGVTLLARLHGLDFNEIAPRVSVSKIAPRPILFMHGSADTRIPLSELKLLEASARPPFDDFVVDGAEHTQEYKLQHDAYLDKAVTFFRRSLTMEGGIAPHGGTKPYKLADVVKEDAGPGAAPASKAN
jgi:pimeloyl-ACP methyl ester carboxylesterase